MYPPDQKMADTPFHTQGSVIRADSLYKAGKHADVFWCDQNSSNNRNGNVPVHQFTHRDIKACKNYSILFYPFNRRCRIYSDFFYYHVKYHLLNMVKIKILMCQQLARFEKSWPAFCQIWIIFTHLKLWIASARHNFKWVKIQIE